MGQFKPMVKMMTTEPTVELKLKKGGYVNRKHEGKEHHGHKAMHHMMDGGVMGALAGAPGMAAPVMGNPRAAKAVAMRRRPMVAPMAPPPMTARPMMKKGGKVHHHAEGGKAEKAEMKEMHKIEKELKHHEHQKASKAHHGLKHGGKVHHKADGGMIDKDETKTTIKGNVGKFAKTKMVDGEHGDSAHGTGEIHEKNAGGFKKGGHHKHHAFKDGGGVWTGKTTKMDDGEHHDSAHGTGEIHESNAGGFKKGGHHTSGGHDAHHHAMQAIHHLKQHHAKGGSAHHMKMHKHHMKMCEGGAYKAGGSVDGISMPGRSVPGGGVNGNVVGTPAGVVGKKTGEVRESNAGGFKHGGHAKKHFATGGKVDSGRAVAMPQGHKKPSPPVAITALSGTFKRGGRV